MDANSLLTAMGLGAIFGFIGQAIRVVVGIKKMFDNSETNTKNFSQKFGQTRFGLSLLLGAIAGVLATLLTDLRTNLDNISNEIIAGLIAAGYAGADFIEGFVRKKEPQP